jgi:signal transduction histidine kinase
VAEVASTSRSTVWLTALVVGLFQVEGSFGAAEGQTDRRAIDGVAVMLVLLGPAALARRDRWPLVAVVVAVAAADVYIGLGYPFGPIFVSVVVALFSAVQAGHRRATWGLAAAGYAGFVVALLRDPRADPGAVHLALVAGWLVMVLAVSEVVRARRDQAAERERAEHGERQRRVGEQRLHLAQELHDVLAHNISLINVQASVALHLLDEQPDGARPALTTIKAASGDALHELRTALDILRDGDAPRAPAPGLADLDTLVAGVRASGLDVRLEHADPVPTLPAAVELAAYRIVQEALTNVTRHARASAVTVRLGYTDGDGVTVEVTDDGTGGPAEPGNGIVGMQERAAALGGTVAAGPAPTRGFRVAAHLPGRPP